jgi:hypothetical protein
MLRQYKVRLISRNLLPLTPNMGLFRQLFRQTEFTPIYVHPGHPKDVDLFYGPSISLAQRPASVLPFTFHNLTHHAVVINDKWYHLFKNDDNSLSLDRRPFEGKYTIEEIGRMSPRIEPSKITDIGKSV